ncbi:hypothetical protein [Granulicella paludicola]|uniref:hypothetical protein n=1 Tax=Granulicella paludicola TaxID=474951 RepID=UPI0021DF5F5B|nr:hypothetical protein [Granulicella paludicola]
MGRALLLLFAAATITQAQEAAPPQAAPTPPAIAMDAPLPDIRQLLLDVERNQRAAEDARRDYTYRVHLVEEDFDNNGGLKKSKVTDSESLTISGVRVDRTVARDGQPLSPEEQKKESERIDKEVAKAKDRRAKLDSKGRPSDTRGDEVVTASRILELGTFSNPRRVLLEGRPTIEADYAGDPSAKTHSPAETAIRDLVGTVWVDEQDHTLVRGEGHMLNDFKVGGGLVLDVHKGFSFTFQTNKINNEVWLPAVVDARGSARILLFGGVNGHIHLTTSDYRKFRAKSTIVGSSDALGPDDQPIPPAPPQTEPHP